jgi:hypothetical protein
MTNENPNLPASSTPNLRLVLDAGDDGQRPELAAEVADVAAALDAIARADRLELSAAASARIASLAAAEARESLATSPISLDAARSTRGVVASGKSKLAWRLAASLALAGGALAAYWSMSNSGSGTATPGSPTVENRGVTTANAGDATREAASDQSLSVQQVALRNAVEDFAAVSELYDDTLSEDLDALASESTALKSWNASGDLSLDGAAGGGVGASRGGAL